MYWCRIVNVTMPPDPTWHANPARVKGAMRSMAVLRPSHCPTMPPRMLVGIMARVGMLAARIAQGNQRKEGACLSLPDIQRH